MTVAVLGPAFRLEDAAEMLGETPAMLLPEVEEAMDAAIMTAAEHTFAFRQQLLRRAVAEPLGRRECDLGDLGPLLAQTAAREERHQRAGDQHRVLVEAVLRRGADGGIEVELIASEDGVSPGQACAFYDAAEGQARVLGGGIIASTIAAATAKRAVPANLAEAH